MNLKTKSLFLEGKKSENCEFKRGDQVNKKITSIILIVFAFVIFYVITDNLKIGRQVDSLEGVPVYHNGLILNSVQGKSYSTDGYYYGLKWQCVEFVQRYYYDVLDYRMPDPTKDAKDYFDLKVPEGSINKVTGLKQYPNNGKAKPQVNDVLVFHGGKYGHVAIVSKVGADFVEIVQQNVYGKPREKLELIIANGRYLVKSDNKLVGWLRK